MDGCTLLIACRAQGVKRVEMEPRSGCADLVGRLFFGALRVSTVLLFAALA
jgi:hypothetical protein